MEQLAERSQSTPEDRVRILPSVIFSNVYFLVNTLYLEKGKDAVNGHSKLITGQSL